MLTFQGQPSKRFCDGRSRRNFLRAGGLGLGGLGLSMTQLLRAESQSGRSSTKSIIMIYLPGGPPHQDMFDLKLDAPADPWRVPPHQYQRSRNSDLRTLAAACENHGQVGNYPFHGRGKRSP